MNIYLPGPSTLLRYTISCGVELASPALTALGEHVGDADKIAQNAYKAGGEPISSTFSDLRRRRGSRPAALVCTAVERVASKVFYHKYHLIGRTRKAINTAIAVLETVEAVCAHHLQAVDSAPPAESLTSTAILGTRPSESARFTLPPHAVSFTVGAFHRLSTTFGGDFHVRLANFLSRVSPRGFLLLKTALEDFYEWLIEKTKEHMRFGRARYPVLPRTTFYLLTLSIAILIFLLAVISAFPADGVVRRRSLQETLGAGNNQGDVNGYNYGGDVCPEEGASNDTSMEAAEGGYDAESEDHTSAGEEDTSLQDRNKAGSVTIQKYYVTLGNDESESENEGEKETIQNPGIIPERIEIVLMITADLETCTESGDLKSDDDSVVDEKENKVVSSAKAVVAFGGIEVDDSLVCKFEQTGGHGAANAASLTSTLPLQIRAEKELPSAQAKTQAAPNTPTSYTVTRKHKRKEIKVKQSRKTFCFPRTAEKNIRAVPKQKKRTRLPSAPRTTSTPTSSAILSTPNRVSADHRAQPLSRSRTPSIMPPSSAPTARQRTRPRSFQELMKNW